MINNSLLNKSKTTFKYKMFLSYSMVFFFFLLESFMAYWNCYFVTVICNCFFPCYKAIAVKLGDQTWNPVGDYRCTIGKVEDSGSEALNAALHVRHGFLLIKEISSLIIAASMGITGSFSGFITTHQLLSTSFYYFEFLSPK